MNLAAACFAQSYAEARGLFLAAAQAAGLAVESHAHPLPGRDGEALAMDVALAADAGAPAVLLVTSACHGVEGYCGSGLQVALLADRALAVAARQAGVALVYVHGLNPYGFSWWRRVTHENVDLNRNWHDFSGPLPANPDYDRIAHLLVPPSWPPPWIQKASEPSMAAMSMIAASTTWPCPDRRLSCSAASTPKARYSAPPP